jgi:uncharacterized protein (TIRG00374 family)
MTISGPPNHSPEPSSESFHAVFLSGWRLQGFLWTVLSGAAGYLGFAIWSGWDDVTAAVAKVGATGVLVALSLSLVNYGLRFARWQAYLRVLGHPVPWRLGLRIYLAGFALTTTPGKAGEALRGVLLHQLGVPYPKSFAALLAERLSDLLAVVLLALLGLSIYPAAQPVIAIGIVAVLTLYAGLSSQRLLEWFRAVIRGVGRLATLLRSVAEILLNTRHCHAPRLLAGATALSLVAWSAEAWAFHLILQWMGIEVPLAFAMFVYAISMLAGALSFMPGGLGGAEAAMVGLLVWHGAGPAEAVAATVLIRLATLWFAVAIGCAELLGLRGARLQAPDSH